MSRNQRRKKRNKPANNQSAHRNIDRDTGTHPAESVVRHRSSTETKSALKTTEFIAYAGAVLAVVLTALSVDADGRGGSDPFGAESAIRYIALLTVGYAVARGLAKSGSHENRDDRATDVDAADVDADAHRGLVQHEDDDRRADDDRRDDHDGRDDEGGATAVGLTDPVRRPAPEDVDGETVRP